MLSFVGYVARWCVGLAPGRAARLVAPVYRRPQCLMQLQEALPQTLRTRMRSPHSGFAMVARARTLVMLVRLLPHVGRVVKGLCAHWMVLWLRPRRWQVRAVVHAS